MGKKRIERIVHGCAKCNAEFIISKTDCIDGMNCPRCGGYLISMGVETVRAYSDDEIAIIYAMDKVDTMTKQQPPLLTIELQDETSAPKVFYKGEEIHLKTNVTFDWETDTDTFGGLSYAIEHYVKENGCPTRNRIERRVKGHAT
ncbi:hypothetical protein ACFSMW_14710 [Virgibacillus halophilus]|uniref:Uncharacterized protein n=1 Tax=Tigheibacillus halophilus TaxID=361280 RepID=A0ABU5CDA7_9BACI|nr:hypothetical protein [Virgibacillus halophilus]